MKHYRRFTARLFAVICFVAVVLMTMEETSHAAGLLKSIDGDGSGVSIASHKVDVIINNGFARTEIDQVFSNDKDYDMEAVYTFPLPKMSSLSELSLWIDGQEFIGEVVEKERAREIYEDQKARGNDTALAEKDEYKTIDVMVGRVPAGREARVRVVYYQPIEIDLNVGRYIYPLAEGNVDDERIQFWTVDEKVYGEFSFHLILKSAFPVKEVRLPGLQNEALINQIADTENESTVGEIYEVTIERPAGTDLSRDIIFYYRLDDSVPARLEIIPFKQAQNEEGTVMIIVTPAADLKPITEGTDWTFILDISGSMNGHKIATLSDGVSRVIGKMNLKDRFRIITFNDKSRDLTSGYITATPENVQEWISRVKTLEADRGTNLYSGLKRAYSKLDDDRTTSFILVTDGVANIGETRQKSFLNLLNTYDIRLFTFVIGNSANQPLLQRLAKESGGFAMNISDADDITGRILQAKSKVLHECLHDVELMFGGEKVKDLTPEYIGNLYMGQQLVMFGRYAGAGEVSVMLKAKVSGQERKWQTSAFLPDVDGDNPEIERLWALSAIEDIMEEIRDEGETDYLRKEVVALGTEYSLVTDYTSMIVLNAEEMENEGIQGNNADRIQRERNAQKDRTVSPVKSYRVDHKSNNNGMFNGRSAPGVGSGPVGPLFVLAAYLLRRRRINKKQ
jgi:Ca-activated chloride channel family protein